MFKFFDRLSDRVKLLAPVVICVIAILGISYLSWETLDRVKVGGPIDANIINGKDLMADVLPPPMYMVEAHLGVHRAADVTDPAEIERFVLRTAALRKEYEDRQTYWRKTLPPGQLKDAVTGPLHAAATDYFNICESQLIPVLRSKNEEKAREIANGALQEKYEAQRAIVDQVVALADAENAIRSKEAAATVKSNSRIMVAMMILLPLISGVMAVIIVRRVTGKTQAALARAADAEAVAMAIGRNQALIEFDMSGHIINANDNFLKIMGYSLEELKGKHHRMFVDSAYASTHDYADFWSRLGRGEFHSADFKRFTKSGKEVWVQGSYNPILGPDGKPYKVSKYVFDITASKNMEKQIREESERQAEEAVALRRKVDAILATVNAIADGDFTQTIPDLGSDAVGQVAVALNQAIESVRETLDGVREVAEQLADASNQMSSASDDIASGAQEQASSLEETASTLEEITATVRQNSDSAQQARQLASGSREVAEKGGQVVSTAIDAMAAINEASKKIADIITAIDEIAFQTNLLALNAAVEAARAGEQGRGFAVVASEVRNLAQRSATAAKKIKTLIQDSVEKVNNGSELVNRSGATLHEIVTSVKRVTDIVAEIAAASREQATGIEQVNKAVSQMDTVTQRNASQTEEMSATAQTLTSQANQLRDLVSKFNLGHEEVVVAKKKPGRSARAEKVKPGAKSRPRPAVAKAIANGNGHHARLDDVSDSDWEDGSGFKEF